MAFTYVAVGSEDTSGSPGQPAGKAANDLLLCRAAARATETANTPTGYTKLLEANSIALFGRIATNDANDTISAFDFWSGTSNNTAQIAAFRGGTYTDLSTIVAHSASGTSTDNNIPNTALTVTTANTLLIFVGRKAKTVTCDGATLTSPAGMDNRIALRWSNGSSTGCVWDYTIQITATNITGSIWDQSINENATSSNIVVSLLSSAGSVGGILSGKTLKSLTRGRLIG